jgi:4-hydroxybenzoate polyprenyltransferase
LLLLVVGAAVAARTAAMGFNRIVDCDFDAMNPRTRNRELPSGQISVRAAVVLTSVAAAAFVAVAFAINELCGQLSPIVLLVLLGYSYSKRFTNWTHLWLGIALALAPLGAWLAGTGSFTGPLHLPIVLGVAVATWVAGFDLIYACQDLAFDRQSGLRSIPARFGATTALRLSGALHLVAVLAFAAFGWWTPLDGFFAVALVVVAALLVYEHRLVSADDLSRVNVAFFTVNGVVSVLLCAAAAADLWW